MTVPPDPAPHEASLEGFAVGRDGCPIFYEGHGKPDAPTVILTDGVGCDGYIWKYLTTALTGAGWRTLHWHYRGHGRTPAPRDRSRVSIADLADDLGAVLTAAECETAVFVGHSMGVQVCLEAYRRLPGRSAGLILICGSHCYPLKTWRGGSTAEVLVPAARMGAQLIPGPLRTFWQTVFPTRLALEVAKRFEINGNLVLDEDFFPYLQGIAKVDPLIFLEMLSSAGSHCATEFLPTIQVPTLVIAGDRDGFTPVTVSQEMAAGIPGAKLVTVAGGSHTTPIERPEEVDRAVLDFLTTVSPNRRPAGAGLAVGESEGDG